MEKRTPRKTPCLLVEDDTCVNTLVAELLESLPIEIGPVLKAQSGTSAIEIFEREKPPIVILDLHLPDYNGASLIGHLRRIRRSVKVILFTGDPGSPQLTQALEQSPQGLIFKQSCTGEGESLIEKLRSAIKAVLSNETFRDPFLHQVVKSGSNHQSSKVSALTAQELRVLSALLSRMSNKDLAKLLGLSIRTVENHLYHASQKLEVHGRSALIEKAQELRLLPL